MENYTIESVLKSDPVIRHLFDVSCPLHIANKVRLKAILIICQSQTVRKSLLDLLKNKLNFESYNKLELDFETKTGDILNCVTKLQSNDFLICSVETQ